MASVNANLSFEYMYSSSRARSLYSRHRELQAMCSREKQVIEWECHSRSSQMDRDRVRFLKQSTRLFNENPVSCVDSLAPYGRATQRASLAEARPATVGAADMRSRSHSVHGVAVMRPVTSSVPHGRPSDTEPPSDTELHNTEASQYESTTVSALSHNSSPLNTVITRGVNTTDNEGNKGDSLPAIGGPSTSTSLPVRGAEGMPNDVCALAGVPSRRVTLCTTSNIASSRRRSLPASVAVSSPRRQSVFPSRQSKADILTELQHRSEMDTLVIKSRMQDFIEKIEIYKEECKQSLRPKKQVVPETSVSSTDETDINSKQTDWNRSGREKYNGSPKLRAAHGSDCANNFVRADEEKSRGKDKCVEDKNLQIKSIHFNDDSRPVSSTKQLKAKPQTSNITTKKAQTDANDLLFEAWEEYSKNVTPENYRRLVVFAAKYKLNSKKSRDHYIAPVVAAKKAAQAFKDVLQRVRCRKESIANGEPVDPKIVAKASEIEKEIDGLL